MPSKGKLQGAAQHEPLAIQAAQRGQAGARSMQGSSGIQESQHVAQQAPAKQRKQWRI